MLKDLDNDDDDDLLHWGDEDEVDKGMRTRKRVIIKLLFMFNL